MNPRLPYSAIQLQKEVSEVDEDATFEAVDLDGLGLYHAVIIHCGDPESMVKAIRLVQGMDRRLYYVEDLMDGSIKVTFRFDRNVELRDRFGVPDIHRALMAAAKIKDEAQSTEPAKKRARKRPVKKASSSDEAATE